MHDHAKEPVDKNLLEEMGYEPTDIKSNTLPRTTVIFFVFVIVSFGLSWLFMYVVSPDMAIVPKASDLERKRVPPPEAPLIQSSMTAKRDMVELAREDKEKATTFAWTDRKNGKARVPIDQAMSEVLAEGLPERPGARPIGGSK
jgi:hypothetical protein